MRHFVLFVRLLLAVPLAGRGLLAQAAHPRSDTTAHDTAFAAMQERGKMVMGVDQYTSTHRFDDLPDGGRITLVRTTDDAAGATRIQQHLRSIATAFKAGNFSSPMTVHATDVPGTKVMAEKNATIVYSVRALPRGAELTIHTTDPDAVRAVHEFLAFQRAAHHVSP